MLRPTYDMISWLRGSVCDYLRRNGRRSSEATALSPLVRHGETGPGEMSADSRRVVLSGLRHRMASCLRLSAENQLVDVESIYPSCATVAKLVDH